MSEYINRFDLNLNSSNAISQNKENTPEDFVINFDPPIRLDKNAQYRTGVNRIAMYYSIFNIDDEYENNTLKYRKKGEKAWKKVTLPNDFYEFESLNEVIQQEIGVVNSAKKNSPYIFYMYPALTTNRLVIEIRGDYEIDLREGDLNEILGFEKRVLDCSVNEGDCLPNLTRGVEDYYIHCNLVMRPYCDVDSDVIFTIPLVDKVATFPFLVEPRRIEWQPVFSNVINYIHIRVTDSFNQLLNLHGQNVSLNLFVEKIT